MMAALAGGLGASTLRAATFTVTTTADAGPGSFRQAIVDANQAADADRIEFDIPGEIPHVIAVATALDPIIYPVEIDGYTQPGAAKNTLPIGNNAVLAIQLSTDAAHAAAGLEIRSAGCAVRGLSITAFRGDGLSVLSPGTVVVEGNFIGVAPDGVTAQPNEGAGIRCASGRAWVGGAMPEQRNVIAGNLDGGIVIDNSPDNFVLGNYVGTDASGRLPLGNGGAAIRILNPGATGNRIGGAELGEGNVIAAGTGTGSTNHGVYIESAGTNTVAGNFIGTDVTGTNALPNAGSGVCILNATGTTIGGTAPGAGNVIAFNTGAGVSVLSHTRNAVLANSIHDNGGLGIDLGTSGVAANDIGDSDAGANQLQNWPMLAAVTNDGTATEIHGTLGSLPNQTLRIEFFVSPAPDATGHGEGKTYLGFTNVTTDAAGSAPFVAVVGGGNLFDQVVTATATDADNNTSEFSLAQSVFLAAPPIITYPPRDAFVWRFGETNYLMVLAQSSAPLWYQWYREGVPIPDQTNRTLWFYGVQPSDLGVYSVVVRNAYGAVDPLSAALRTAPNSGLVGVSTLVDTGPGSLRQAILDANTSAVPATIYFNLAGSSPFTLTLASPLPPIEQPTVLDATLLPGYAGQPLLELDGGGLAGDGLVIAAGHCTVRGLAIGFFGGSGIRVEGGGTNQFEGNYLGVRADGITAWPNAQHGLLLVNSAGNRIGGEPGAGNVISGNAGDGIHVDGDGAAGTVIRGNLVGTDASGLQPLGNSHSGVHVSGGATHVVGGPAPGDGNRIAHNGRNGVLVFSGQCALRGNAIYANAAQGIDLGGDGVTPNDTSDSDAGPNELQNTPEILSASHGPSGTSVSGTLHSSPNTVFRIEFFGGAACGQAERVLGSVEAVADASGDALFSAAGLDGDASGLYVCATATDPEGNTSELSPCGLAPTPPVFVTQPLSQTVAEGATVVFEAGYSAIGPVTVQWRLNGVNIKDATNAVLILENVQATQSGTYSVVVSTPAGAASSAGAVLTVELPSLDFKDDFGALTRLNSASGAGRGSNLVADAQADEPLHAGKTGGVSVWIAWQAPETGIATFTTAGSTFDTLLAIYTGTVLTKVAEVASDDDSGGFHTSAVQFNAAAGVQYKIAVDGFGAARGAVVLNWSLEPTSQTLPVIISHPASQTLAPGDTALLTVAATGTALTYQWFFENQPIPGAVGNTLTLDGLGQAHVGEYVVRVSNAVRSVKSRAAHLELAADLGGVSQARSANKFLDGLGTALVP
ncbi:MAG: immunoglobulin domain-containing protein [Verrucomicrobia bacterium]|nr:immunoglobulin domain-containing protein [Verrucomicrobiota bacterium]